MDRGDGGLIVHGVTESDTTERLNKNNKRHKGNDHLWRGNGMAI